MSGGGQSNLNMSEAKRKRQRGQLVLEYILLMILAVGISALIKRQFIGGDPDDPQSAGIMTQFVFNIIGPIATDTPSD